MTRPTSAVEDSAASHPPYRVAAAVALVVLLGFIVSLAPSVTFWDAGEFIAAMKSLGIPHPPGTPLFVMMGHVWGMIFPVGEFAWRTNLLTALFSSASAACWFLVLQESAGRCLPEMEAKGRAVLQIAAGAAGALIAAFSFTNWLNSNETEVYAVATFTIGAVCWLLLRWRAARGTPREPRYLLLVGYLLGIAIGNHLLGLLAGPATVAFVVAELRRNPSADPAVRRREWGYAAALAGLWALLTGIGLGSGTLIVLGGVAFLAALVFVGTTGELAFGLLLLGVALVGVTPYLYLYLRSAQHPMLNEAAPATWDALLAVMRRENTSCARPGTTPPSAMVSATQGGASRLSGCSSSTISSTSTGSGPRRSPGGSRYRAASCRSARCSRSRFWGSACGAWRRNGGAIAPPPGCSASSGSRPASDWCST